MRGTTLAVGRWPGLLDTADVVAGGRIEAESGCVAVRDAFTVGSATAATIHAVKRESEEAGAARAGDASRVVDPAADAIHIGDLATRRGRRAQAKRRLHVIGGRNSHDVLRAVLADRPPSRVLDAPAGTGVLSEFLRSLGWDVHCADIDPEHFQVRGLPFRRVDLNRGLPYGDASFDTVVCANGLHRLWNPAGALNEFARVLRRGGRLHLTVNNYASVTKRLRFLILGSITNTINESRYAQTIADPEANVRHVLLWPQLANLLESAGFAIVERRAASVRASHRVLAPLVWLIRLGTLFVSPGRARRNRLSETRSRAILPGGKYVYVEAVRT